MEKISWLDKVTNKLAATATICPRPVTLIVVYESRVTWATFVPILVFILPKPLNCSRLRPDVRDRRRQTDKRQTSDERISAEDY